MYAQLLVNSCIRSTFHSNPDCIAHCSLAFDYNRVFVTELMRLSGAPSVVVLILRREVKDEPIHASTGSKKNVSRSRLSAQDFCLSEK